MSATVVIWINNNKKKVSGWKWEVCFCLPLLSEIKTHCFKNDLNFQWLICRHYQSKLRGLVSSQSRIRIKFLLCVSPADISCSSRALVRRLSCQERGRVTPWRLGPCTRLHPGPSLAAAWPDHCLPSTSLTAAATGSARPCPRRCSPSPWPCCSYTSSVSRSARTFAFWVFWFCLKNHHFQNRALEGPGNWEACQEAA